MGIKGLFEISGYESDGPDWKFGVRIDPAHPVFQGHFPGMPVLPGVCSMYMVRECVRAACGRTVSYETVKECKFVNSVLPSEHKELTVWFTLKETATGVNVTGGIRAADEIMVKIKAELA